MPSPSAFSKFVLSVLKFLVILKFLRYTQNILGIINISKHGINEEFGIGVIFILADRFANPPVKGVL